MRYVAPAKLHSIHSCSVCRNITPKRTKRKLRQETKVVTPGAKVAAKEVLRDLAMGIKCSATETLSDSEFETSQQVADITVDLKRLERKRNK